MYPMPGENAKPGTTFLLSFTIAAPADLVKVKTPIFECIKDVWGISRRAQFPAGALAKGLGSLAGLASVLGA